MRRILTAALISFGLVACSSAPGSVHARSSASDATSPTSRSQRSALEVRIASLRLNEAISREVALVTDKGILVVGGLGPSGASSSKISLIASDLGSVRLDGSLARAAHDAGGAILSGRAFVFGGGETTSVDTVQLVEPSAASRIVGHLPQPRSDLSTVSINDAAYVLCGFDGSRLLPDVLRTTDGIHFTKVGALQRAARYAAVAALDNLIYVFGGTTGSTDLSTIQAIDVTTGETKIVGRLPHSLSHASAVAFAGTIYVIGGRDGSTVSDEILRFDPTNNKVATAGRLPYAESDAAAVALSDRILVLGGERGTAHRQTANVIEISRLQQR
ncbi:MAG: Kelch repeat-containing protein [Actinomycetota bacterium]